MTDCLRHWVINYHIDGFRINQEVMPSISLVSDPIISGVKLMTSYWDENMLRDTGALNNDSLAEYNEGFMNDARRFLKSDEGMVQTFAERFKRNSSVYSIINFITHVNGFTLMDLVSYDIKHNETNGEGNRDGTEFNYSWNCGVEGKTRKRAIMRSRMNQIRNAFMMLLCSQGTPMILAGDEFGNSQLGNNNAYCHDDNITWLNWNHTKSEQDILDFVKKLIAFRKEHCILHAKKPFTMLDTKGVGIPDISIHGTQAWRADFSNYSRKYPYIDFRPDREIGNEVLTVEHISKTIDGVKVLDDISFVINREDKVAFVGSNTIAATTLFQILTGEMEPDEGTFKWGVTTSFSYFPKDNTELFDRDETIVDWLMPFSPEKDPTYVRGFLGRMLFPGEDGVKKVNVLSGGERVRVMLSKMMILGSNVLVIDEPTAHLDMESITALNNGLIKFPGVILFTSQDHQFIQTIANRIMEITPGGLIDKLTTYDEYLESDEMARKRQILSVQSDDED